MYKLNKSVDLSFLLGANVEQICVSNSALIVNFDKSSRLTILSGFTVELAGNKIVAGLDSSSYAADAPVLFPLIGDVIAGAGATENGGLRLNFETGAILEVFDDSEQFESFWIGNGDELIVV